MRVYNYWTFAKAFELGVSNPNSTKIAKALFEPIVRLEDIVNQNGNPYVINSHYAKAWNDQTDDIPRNLKIAAGRPDAVNSIGDYFSTEIIDVVINQLQEKEMYNALVTLIRDSDLESDKIKELLDYYNDGDIAKALLKL